VVISTASAPSSGAAEIGSDYLTTETHYLFVAGRILSAMREGAKMVLLTGDPPPDLHLLSQALRQSATAEFSVIPISGESEAINDQALGAGSTVAALAGGGGNTMAPVTPEAAPPIFLVSELDGLAAPQIEKICDAVRHGPRSGSAAVLLARRGFLARLEEPALQCLQELIAARLSFDEISQDESIEFLRHQLTRRHQTETSSNRAGALRRVLVVSGALLAAGVITFFVLQKTRSVGEPSVYSATGAPASPQSTAPVAVKPAPPTVPEIPSTPSPAAAPRQLPSEPAHLPARSQPAAPDVEKQTPETPSHPSSPPPTRSAAVQPLSRAEIAALVTRGDDFLKAGDIASARLFYERGANAGDGAAALRLGATFDPGFLVRAGVRGIAGDPAQASAWYSRARDLGEAAAAERLKSLEQLPTERGSPGR
jgi:hypothetical protein